MGKLFLLKLIKLFGLNGVSLYYKLVNPETTHIKLKIYPNKFFFRKNTKDIDIFRHIILDEDYKYKLNPLPTVIIDGGAFAGYSSVYFANEFNKATVYSIEVDPSNYEYLLKNTQNYKNIIPINKALWNENMILNIQNINVDTCSVMVDNSGNGTSIETITIPEIITNYSIETIDILKVDIEGAEKELFENGSEEWLPKVKLIFIELHDHKKMGSFRVVSEALSKMNFAFVKTQSEYLIFKNLSFD